MKIFLRQLLRYFKQWFKLEPHLVVGDPAAPYMLRWWLIPRNRFFNIYLHKFLNDDDDRAKHDHPWASLSILLYGQIREIVEVSCTLLAGALTEETRLYRPGSVVYRSPYHTHRIELPDGKPAWTIFITGPKTRDWGFWCTRPRKWIYWRDFGSRGCG